MRGCLRIEILDLKKNVFSSLFKIAYNGILLFTNEILFPLFSAFYLAKLFNFINCFLCEIILFFHGNCFMKKIKIVLKIKRFCFLKEND